MLLLFVVADDTRQLHGDEDDVQCAHTHIPRGSCRMETDVAGLPQGCKRNAEMKAFYCNVLLMCLQWQKQSISSDFQIQFQ